MLRKNILFAVVFCLFLNVVGFSQNKQSLSKLGNEIDVTGEINGAPYRIRVPATWNGTLLVYGHGYRDKADHPGEVDNRTPDIAPSPALEPVLLGLGYAIAGSAYQDNGWAVGQGYEDSKSLVAYFKNTVGQPNRTLFWGFSMGSVIGFKNAEDASKVYDGVMCGCAVGAGASTSWDSAGDLLVAYNSVFGMPPAWGNPGDVRDDIDFDTEVLAKLGGELINPANFPAFEFIRLVTGTPGRGITPPSNFYPNWVVTDMFFTTEARSELERRAGGAVVQNLNRNYELTTAERSYLTGLGITATQMDNWLIAMNNQRVYSAPQSSRDYLATNADYSGKIQVPVLTMHTIVDPLVTVTQEYNYARNVASAGRPNMFTRIRNSPGGTYNPRLILSHSELLYQTYTTGSGHCNFTGEQLITAITTLDSWVATKNRPTQANFPTALGFDNTFTPPPMNQP